MTPRSGLPRVPPPVAGVPEHLRGYVATQDPALYTAIDHAAWRFILRVSRGFFERHAHEAYVDGLRRTGIEAERIPLVSEMDACLRRFGWGAVPVVGFIPPAVFFEFLSLGILPIACDMRRLEHLGYTPAPDIVHEAAGHAPILADPAYAAYLRRYGELARKVIFSTRDEALYDAVRSLSDTKERTDATPDEIAQAQAELDRATRANTEASEATWLARMAWWTIEYGLVGDIRSPRIYGAGLLSSVTESSRCLGPSVRKVPFSVDCIDVGYDITRPQPQLFVTPDFPTLARALDELASRMAFRRGNLAGLERARDAGTVTTTQLDSGVQASGVVREIRRTSRNEPCYVRLAGPCQLSFADEELPGHGADRHREGFGMPIGRLRGGRSPADVDPDAVRRAGGLEFESGLRVRGELQDVVERNGRRLLLSFARCTVTDEDEILYRPEWGIFDLACGQFVSSVFGGAADRVRYHQAEAVGGFRQPPGRPKSNLTPDNRRLAELYQRVRDARQELDGTPPSGARADALAAVHEELVRHHPDEWLLRLELLELFPALEPALLRELTRIARSGTDAADLVRLGLEARAARADRP